MNRLQKLYVGIRALLRNPSKINVLAQDTEYWLGRLKKKYPSQFPLASVPIAFFWDAGVAQLRKICSLEGSSLMTDLVLLKSLANRFDQASYFEIGTWRGESALNLSDVCKECVTLNLPKGEIAKRWGKSYADLHAVLIEGNPAIRQIWADSRVYDFAALQKKYDLIFIDGHHAYETVRSDTENVFRHLIHPESIVVWHDYGLSPERMRPEVLLGILDGVPKALHGNIHHVSNTLCAVYTPFEVPASQQYFPVTPEVHFRVDLKLDT